MVCRSSELRDLRMTPYELVMGRRMPTPCLRTSGKGPSLAVLEDEMRAYVTYMATLHKKISTYVSDRQRQEEVQERLDEQKRSTVQPGDKVFIKVFRRKWYNARREGPFEVVRSTGTAVQVKGSPTWYHLSHCVKAPREEALPTQSQDVEGSREPDETAQVENNVDDLVHIVDNASGDFAVNGQERRFNDIDFQHVPETAGPISVECKTPKITKGCDGTAGQSRDTVEQRSPRPIRRRIKPRRYED